MFSFVTISDFLLTKFLKKSNKILSKFYTFLDSKFVIKTLQKILFQVKVKKGSRQLEIKLLSSL